MHTNQIETVPYTGTELPSIAGVNVGDTTDAQFTDGTVVSYTWDGAAWIPDFQQTWSEQRICLNTATPTFTPANLLMPTVAEVQAWTLANLTEKQRLNGTHVVYFIAGQGGDCDNPDYTWVLNQGSELVTRTQNSILTLPNYTALRNLTKYNHDIVIVDDWTYTGPDGNTYTTLGGIFKRTHERTITENGGTIIVATNGDIWERDWDGINGRPEWWEVGGYDRNGNNYVSKLTSANGIYNDTDRLKNAAAVVSNLQLYPNKNYTVDAGIRVVSETVTGNNATLTRVTTPASLTTATSSIGAFTVTVADASLYRVGQNIFFVNTGAANGGQAFGENVGITDNHIITNINTTTDVITFTNPLAGNVGVGWKAVLIFTLLDLSNTTDNGAVEIKNLNFDGNRTGNTHSYDWRYGDDIAANNTDTKIVIQNCHFKNSVVECINYGKLHILDCSFENLGGSFVHVSAMNQNEAIVVIQNCHGTTSNQVTNALTGHSEATITSSANTTHVRIIGCNFRDCEESVVTMDSSDDFDLIMSNNHFKDYKYVINGFTGGSIKVEKKVRIHNNTFDNCGPIYLASANPNTIYEDTAISHVTINDNTFINSTMKMEHVGYVNIVNNNFYWDNSKTTKYDYVTNPLSSGQQAFNHFIHFDRLYIQNNVFEYPNVYNANTQYGLLLQHNGVVRKTSAGADTEYLFAQDVKVVGNTFAGFKYAITTINSTGPQYANLIKQAVGWEYKNNIIYMSRNTGANNGVGIFIDPGVVCEGNTIYTNSTIPCYSGIIVAGVNSTGNAHNRLLGGIAINNKILGCSSATAADIVANGDAVRYNVTCVGNMTRDDIANATNGYFSGNFKMTTANYPQLSTMTCPQWRYFGEDSGQY